MKKKLITGELLADIVRTDIKIIRHLASSGVLIEEKNNCFDLLPAIGNYCNWLSKKTSGNSLTDERTRLTKLQADLAEIELAEKNGDVLPYDEVKADWIKFVGSMKARLLNLPTKYAPLCYGKTIVEIKQIVEDGIYQALAELAQLKYEQRKVVVGGNRHSESTGENARKRMGRRRKNAKSRGKRRAR